MIERSKKTIQNKKGYDLGPLDFNDETVRQITYSPSFIEKTRKARERLKRCPIPEEFIKEITERKNRL